MAVAFELIDLDDEEADRRASYRWSAHMARRLNKLRGHLPHLTETAILELAAGHLLAAMETDGKVCLKAPSEAQEAPKP